MRPNLSTVAALVTIPISALPPLKAAQFGLFQQADGVSHNLTRLALQLRLLFSNANPPPAISGRSPALCRFDVHQRDDFRLEDTGRAADFARWQARRLHPGNRRPLRRCLLFEPLDGIH